MPRILFTPQARGDLLAAWLYVAADNTDAASKLIRSIKAKIATLAESPHIGRLRKELGEEMRSFPVGNYVVYYRPVDDGVRVFRVLHGARDLTGLF